MTMRKLIAFVFAAAVAGSLAACSVKNPVSVSEASENQEAPAFVTVTSLNGAGEKVQLEVPYDPQRIAVLDMAALDILDALGVGDRVVEIGRAHV